MVASPLRRAVETAAPIAAAHGLEVEIVDGLIEYDSNSDHYIPMEELRVNKDERWTAMVEGRWEAFGADPPEVFRARVGATVDDARRAVRRASASWRCATAASINVALGSVLGIVEQPLWFEPGYTSLHRVKASRIGRPVDRQPQRARASARRGGIAHE